MIDALGILLALLGSTDLEVTTQPVPKFEMQISTQKLADDLYLLEGAGGNVLAFVWDEGVHLGDCYLNGSFPVIDYSSDGTFTGTIAAADTALGMADAKTRIVPGHGHVSNAVELRAWRDMLAAIYSRVKTAASAGKTLAQIKAEKPAREWEGRLPKSFVTSDHVVEEAFRSATAAR